MQDERASYFENGVELVILTNVKFRCTNCKRTLPGSLFGLRKMEDGTIRNQPQCQSCRSRYGKSGEQLPLKESGRSLRGRSRGAP